MNERERMSEGVEEKHTRARAPRNRSRWQLYGLEDLPAPKGFRQSKPEMFPFIHAAHLL